MPVISEKNIIILLLVIVIMALFLKETARGLFACIKVAILVPVLVLFILLNFVLSIEGKKQIHLPSLRDPAVGGDSADPAEDENRDNVKKLVELAIKHLSKK